ncbi:MAG TPA: hypothetical protein VJH24_01135 [Candidatus Bilamarchaeaceae archaeon]|nr:hypothetical protein [Candidatus Bilamarchaeaceae archaeon]
MKRCFFSDAEVSGYEWKHGGEYVCYPCYMRKWNKRTATKLARSIRLRDITKKEEIYRLKGESGSRWIPKIKVDRRIIGGTVLPPVEAVPARRWITGPQLEGIQWPRIIYPYITYGAGGG